MNPPIAFTYEADVHCPAHTFARFGQATIHSFVFGIDIPYPWPPDDARDNEGNEIGAIAPWDDWCTGCQDNEPPESSRHGLYCGDDGASIRECSWAADRANEEAVP